jgi:hypothetical protein
MPYCDFVKVVSPIKAPIKGPIKNQRDRGANNPTTSPIFYPNVHSKGLVPAAGIM